MDFVASVRETGPLFTAVIDRVTGEHTNRQVEAGAEYLAGQIRAAAPKASGGLRADIRVSGFASNRGVATSVPYAAAVDQGSVAGYTKIEPVAEWAEKVLGLDPLNARRMAFAFSRTKAKHKTEGKEFFYHTFDRLAGYIQSQFLDSIGGRVVRDLGG